MFPTIKKPAVLSDAPASFATLYASWEDVAAIYANARFLPSFAVSTDVSFPFKRLGIIPTALCWNNCPDILDIKFPRFSTVIKFSWERWDTVGSNLETQLSIWFIDFPKSLSASPVIIEFTAFPITGITLAKPYAAVIAPSAVFTPGIKYGIVFTAVLASVPTSDLS